MVTVKPEPNIINSNGKLVLSRGRRSVASMCTDNRLGATNFRGQIIFTGEGQGADTPPTLYLMNPEEPYNTSGKADQARST